MVEEVKEGEDVEVLEGEQIYLLMKKEYRLSRNTRALWYFSHINKEIRVSNLHLYVDTNCVKQLHPRLATDKTWQSSQEILMWSVLCPGASSLKYGQLVAKSTYRYRCI